MEEQLPDPLILRFLEGRMSPEEYKAFRKRLSEEPDLVVEVAAYEALTQHRNERLRQKWRRERSQTPPGGWAQKALLLAATVAGIGGLTILFWPPSKSVYSCGSKKYERLQQSDLLSTTTDDADAQNWRAANQAYQEKNFVAAIEKATLLFASTDYRDKARLLAGAAEQENGQPEAALLQYAKIATDAKMYYGRGQINSALAKRCLGQEEEAQYILQTIKEENGYSPALVKKAKAILEEIQK
jgi:hypothetical protein